jgi:hypothetical protein
MQQQDYEWVKMRPKHEGAWGNVINLHLGQRVDTYRTVLVLGFVISLLIRVNLTWEWASPLLIQRRKAPLLTFWRHIQVHVECELTAPIPIPPCITSHYFHSASPRQEWMAQFLLFPSVYNPHFITSIVSAGLEYRVGILLISFPWSPQLH